MPAKTKTLYSVHPGVAMVQKWIDDMPDKTGRSFDQWLKLIRKSGPSDVKACSRWLKSEHGFGSNTASWLASRAIGKEGANTWDESPEKYLKEAQRFVADMYGAKKAALKPLYDKLLELGLKTGKEAKACPCQTMVPLYRNHVFAQIKPTTNTRIDLGLALGSMMKAGKTIPARLIDTGGYQKKDRITHRIPITSLRDIDSEVKQWLKTAYDLDAKE